MNTAEVHHFDRRFLSSSIPMHEQVRDYLLEQIQGGRLKPGDVLPPERKLAEELEVSRHTLRQALSALESFGLIEIRHGSGIYLTASASDAAVVRVAESVIDREGSIVNVVEVRRGLEPFIARRAAERRSALDLVTLGELVSFISDEESAAKGMERSSFHREIAKIAKNPVFDGVMRTLITGRRRAEAFIKVIPTAKELWEAQHQEIFEAIKSGDGDAAERAMADHMDSVLHGVTELQSNAVVE